MHKDNFRKLAPFLGILILATAIRLILVFSATWYPRSDTRDYHEFAFNLMQGNGYVCYFNEHPAYQGFVQKAYRPPGYPLLLAGIYSVFGFNPHAAMLANVIFELFTLTILYRLALYYTRHRIALGACATYALCPIWVPNLMTESSFTLFFLLSMYILQNKRWCDNMVISLFLSIAICFAIMLRPIGVVLFIPPAIEALVEIVKKRRFRILRYVVLTGLATSVYLTFWIARNYSLYDTFFLTSNANQHIAGSYGINHSQAMAEYRNKYQRIPNEAEFNAYMGNIITEVKHKTPWLATRVYFKNFIGLLSLEPVWELSGWLWEVTYKGHPVINALYRGAYYLLYMIYPLGILGMIIAIKSRITTIIMQVVAGFLLVHPLVSSGNVRFMASIVPIFCLYLSFLLYVLIAGMSNKQMQLTDDPKRIIQG